MRIKNWHQFQHFKDRKPPWIKLYRDLLDDLDWHELEPKASKVLVQLWLIASEDNNQQGNLPSIKSLAFRLRMPEKDLSVCIAKLNHWLIQDDINTISLRYQDDAPETETETETETKTEADIFAESDKSPTVVEFIPLVDGSEWPVPESFAVDLEKSYPAVDMKQTLREIRAWNLANPKNRKTISGIKRHINQWFSKEQNRG